MKPSISLGRVFGFRVGLNWSVLVVFGLIAWSLGSGIFPSQYPGQTVAAYAAAGTAAALLFWFSLLAHEVAHALVARRSGLGVERIDLWLFGGVSRLQGLPKSAGADFCIAGSGPLTSLGLGAGFIGITYAIGATIGDSLPAGVCAWLGITNLALAVFNLLPGAPLDGGRLLRAFLWHRHGSRRRAAHTATTAGQVLGYVIIAAGALEILYFGAIGGIWLSVLGWFLIGAARAERSQIDIQDVVGRKTVGDVMNHEVEAEPAELSVEEFIDKGILRHRHQSFPITNDGGGLAGLVAVRNLRGIPRRDWRQLRLRDVAAPADQVTTARIDELLIDVLPRLGASAEGKAVVMSDGHLAGIVSAEDIARAAAARAA